MEENKKPGDIHLHKIEFLKKFHAKIVSSLDTLNGFAEFMKSTFSEDSPLIPSAFQKNGVNLQKIFESITLFSEMAKKIEGELNIYLYPDMNEVFFTFDELKELQEAQKDWENKPK